MVSYLTEVVLREVEESTREWVDVGMGVRSTWVGGWVWKGIVM